MKLVLLNDLPLFSPADDADHLEETVRTQVEAARRRFPAITTYIGFGELIHIWEAATSGTAADVILLVGTRPPLLARYARAGFQANQIVHLTTSRASDTAGRTASVDVTGPSHPSALHQASHLLVADDVAMSATTLRCVLRSGLMHPDTVLSVRTAFATAVASQRLHTGFPAADVRTERILDFVPVTEGTAIFLSALLFGSLHGRLFLSQRALLRPFFGENLAPLHDLRDLMRRRLSRAPAARAESGGDR